ncbi:MAG TPA: universal stress protein [Rhizobacter sp.]|nr:universal stress protein [Rhizobacter sp.]
MYQHLLVPLDDSPVAATNIASAVKLARKLGARITFFHATPDWGATSEGEITRLVAPERFPELALGQTNAVLTKALASAKVAGVPCDSVARTNDRPAEAIVEVAQSLGCDLIVMASHGKGGSLSGWLHNSQTERVLRRAPVALLVTRVETAQPLSDAERAIAIIQDEHRSIAVVVQSMRALVQAAPGSELGPILKSLDRMVAYLYEFPERVHHPKEEQHLHRLLRERAPASDRLLTDLENQHRAEGALIGRVLECVAQAHEGTADGVQVLGEAVDLLADHVLHHIGFEERVLLPVAREQLNDADWAEIAQAFASNNDPRYGDLPAEDFRRMFTQIANSVSQNRPLALNH